LRQHIIKFTANQFLGRALRGDDANGKEGPIEPEQEGENGAEGMIHDDVEVNG